jgi:hypothetical protein
MSINAKDVEEGMVIILTTIVSITAHIAEESATAKCQMRSASVATRKVSIST